MVTIDEIDVKTTNTSSICDACYEDLNDNKQNYMFQLFCFHVHEECLNANIPSRHKHPLKLTRYADCHNEYQCCLCGIEGDGTPSIYYKCSQYCSYDICIPCARKPLIVKPTKAHEHELQQIPIKVSFTCLACGLCNTDYPCICHQCCFIIHRACISLPRVIYINYHDHRISHVSSLGLGKWICGVCREPVNGEFGAYSCLVCPNYAVHSKCTTRGDVWDKNELEGIPENEEKEESRPFEVIDQNVIKHFSHEHNLKVSMSSSKLHEEVFPREEDKNCYACTLPLFSELCYKCTQCDFILHDACANLPRKKRHMLSRQQFTLYTKDQYGKYFANHFVCLACDRYCTGFPYNEDKSGLKIDVRCASISGAFKHKTHPHWLFLCFDYMRSVKCNACHLVCWFHLQCNKRECDGYNLCFRCATLPTQVSHKYDDHPLSLCYGEINVHSAFICGICEEEIYSKSWFYKCNDCGSTLHSKCAFGNLIHSRPGYSLLINRYEFDILPNNRLSRPICFSCKARCMSDLVLNSKEHTDVFICCSCGFRIISDSNRHYRT